MLDLPQWVYGFALLAFGWYILKSLRRLPHWIANHREATRRQSQKEIAYAFDCLVDGHGRVEAMMRGQQYPEPVELRELERVFQDAKGLLMDHLVRQRWPDITEAELHGGGPADFDRRLEVFLQIGEDCRQRPRESREKSARPSDYFADEKVVPPLGS